MKIATWNVNSVRARKDALIEFLNTRQPDVVCLQETKVEDEGFPSVDLLRIGYRTLHRGQRGYNGVAILSKKALTEGVCNCFDDGESDEEARLLSATCDDIHVISVYVPNGQSVGSDRYHDKLRWLGRLRGFLDRRFKPTDNVIMCGDFNVAPEPRDVFDPPRFEGELQCTELERKALRRVVDWGLTDVFRAAHPEPHHFTWWDYRAGAFQKNLGMRIDHFYVSAPLLPRCVAIDIDRELRGKPSPSDHAPVILTLE